MKKYYGALVVLLAIFISLFFYQKSYAFIGFGGKILTTTPCTNGLLLSIGPPVGGLFLLPPTARVYSFYKLTPGTWTLGMYSPVGVCVLPPPAPSITTRGIILMIGTSY